MNNQIPQHLIDEIRQSNDIVDVVGEYVSLKRQGRNYFGLCPFHNESTPSFSVTQEKQIFHCFGCGKGGNVFTFLMEHEGFSFLQAVEHLAQKSGHALPEVFVKQENQSNQSIDQVSLQAFEWLTKFYHHVLAHAKEALIGKQYLEERGLSQEIINVYQIGFSPHANEVTTKFLEKKSFNLQHLASTGVFTRNDQNQIFDRFRGRIVFPIRNHLGKTVGYGGRSINGEEPKYLNSPESALFQKSKMLFNFDLARSEMKKKGQAILFEGYMDVITAAQAGITNGVATLGTSATEHQAALLKRYVDHVVICYDGDSAGFNAAYKAARLFLKAGCQIRVATLPDGSDPDAFIKQNGGERFKREVIEESSTYMGFVMTFLKKGYNLKVEADRIAYVNKIIEEIAGLNSAIDRDHYARELANEHQLSFETILNEVNHLNQARGNDRDKAATKRHTKDQNLYRAKKKLLPAFYNAERRLLAYMLYDHSIAEKIKHILGASFNVDKHKIIVTHLYAFYEEGNKANVSQFIERIDDEALKNDIIELAMESISPDISDSELNDYINIISEEQGDKANIRALLAEQKKAELNQDYVKAAQIGMEIVQIRQRLAGHSQ
ncbi:DNA primase [Amphibacillus marinus]|uniref:DNA primase n=1 Tax=Amphibacillus marinus TaxID=872970 RepID=A0A1H8HI79_9BACI|nr:DNA primase [Amphibacillus marinus]SEN55921.1 DNA primase [Amphibacillus marinus]